MSFFGRILSPNPRPQTRADFRGAGGRYVTVGSFGAKRVLKQVWFPMKGFRVGIM